MYNNIDPIIRKDYYINYIINNWPSLKIIIHLKNYKVLNDFNQLVKCSCKYLYEEQKWCLISEFL
jgi:hypothetical protein